MAVVSFGFSLQSCITINGLGFAASNVRVTASVDQPHYLGLYYDGFLYAGPWYVTPGSSLNVSSTLPADDKSHSVTLRDTGSNGTAATISASQSQSSSCSGIIESKILGEETNPTTKQKTVSVWVANNSTSTIPFPYRVLLDGSPVSDSTLPLGGSASVNVTIQADGQLHKIVTETKAGTSWYPVPILWHSVQGLGAAPPEEPPPAEEATEFVPGETVLIGSLESDTPLATDGSEWVLMEVAREGTENWTPAGAPGGLIYPGEDGSWAASIQTTAATYPVGTDWTVRTRRFRNFAESAVVEHDFIMVAGSVPSIPTTPPVIVGPPNHSQHGNSWMWLFGTGTPGSLVEFETEHDDGVGLDIEIPQSTTVGKDGTWRTEVFGMQRSYPTTQGVATYTATSSINGQSSGQSNPLDVTWRNQRR
ncbi:hypothetical protein [Acrocarpospora sp. B8E8]|uniref:hypothetical protein n=1 Tax=Acrocarpospora sp. B8E8 TaxID=3153572 RepID=UPI00325CFFFB